MTIFDLELRGIHVHLEPLTHAHTDAPVAAASDRALYQWSLVPHEKDEVTRYIDMAVAWRNAGTAVPFATVRASDDTGHAL